MDGDILVVYGWSHFDCIWTESFWLYMNVILVVYGWSHFGCIWMESFWFYMDGIYNQNDSIHIQPK